MKKISFKRKCRYFLEAVPVYFFFGFLRILPIDIASGMMGKLLQKIGPLTKAHRIGEKNLKAVMPEKSPAERQLILKKMWDNLGRVLGEFPHITRTSIFKNNDRLEIVGKENVLPLLDAKKPIIFVSGHFANWELASLGLTFEGYPMDRIYRKANNIFIEPLIQWSRRKTLGKMVPKGVRFLPSIVEALDEGTAIGMLVDQKLREGIKSPFCGRDASTTTLPANLALKYDALIVPGRIERLKGARFRLTAYPPLKKPTGDVTKEKVAELTHTLNKMVSQWIEESPEQWLWIHKRWSDIKYK